MITAVRSAAVRIGYYALKAGLRAPSFELLNRFARQAFLRDLLQRLRINCVLDVGANIGWFARHLRMMGYQGHIFSFEPLGENCRRLHQLARADPLWQPVQLALGRESGLRPFNVVINHGNTVYSSFLRPKNQPVAEVVEVEVQRLDAILPELISAIDHARIFLKIDTQGYDLEVLRGAENCLRSILLLQSEISVTPIYEGMPHYLEALAYYESLGFALVDLDIVSRTPQGPIVEYDCLMVRPDHLPAKAMPSARVHTVNRPHPGRSCGTRW